MNVPRARLLICLVTPFLGACGAAPTGRVSAAPVTYTCCEAGDVDRLYQPGQTLTLHWIVVSPNKPAATPSRVELTAHLTGPFSTMDDLKAPAATQTAAGMATFMAAPVRPSGTSDERPVSTIVIGPEAKPGYYNLETSVIGDDNAVRGGSIIQVVPPAN